MTKKSATGVGFAIVALLTAVFSVRCCCPRTQPRVATVPPLSPIGAKEMSLPPSIAVDGPTEAMMRNVWFHSDDTIILRIHDLRGEMLDRAHGPLNFDDPRSFILTIDDAHIGIDGPGLSDLFNNYVFAYPGAPLRNLQVKIANGSLEQEGVMHKIIDIPFRMIAVPSLTSDGRIRVHPTKIEICSLNGKALMKAFGISLQKVLDLSKAKGVTVEENDLIIDPLVILPPPEIKGKLTAIEVQGDELLQTFGGGNAAPLSPPVAAENLMYFRGGTLRMGKLFMPGGDMEVIDPDPSDPFEFYLAYYNSQLAAGFTHNRLDYGLDVYMRDYADVGQPLRPGEEHIAK